MQEKTFEDIIPERYQTSKTLFRSLNQRLSTRRVDKGGGEGANSLILTLNAKI